MIEKTNSNIISWNIQSTNCSVSGSKFDDPEFCNIFNKSQFICLQEIRQPVTHPGYRVFNNTRKDNRHGGVCIMISNCLARGVSKVQSQLEDVVACKLEKTFFDLEEDLFLVNSYIKPAQTSIKTSGLSGLEILAELDQLLNNLHGKGDIIMCGDFNARIGKDCDFIKNERNGGETFLPLPDDYIAQDLRHRNSKDTITNSYKRPFLDLLINNKLHILNGRTLGDTLGDFTCIKHNGASVVDYFVISENSNKYISHLTVLPFTPYSDHKPLRLRLRLPTRSDLIYKQLHEAFKPAPRRYKIDTDSHSDLSKIMGSSSTTQKTNNILNTDFCDTTEKTYELSRQITEHLQQIADQCLRKSNPPNTKKTTITNKKPWFTPATRDGKKGLARATNTVSQFPDSDYLRKNFYRVKKTYKKLVKKSKNRFFDKLNSDIESGKVLNWNHFKKLKTHKSSGPKFDALDMENFENFFKKLYSNVHESISPERKKEMLKGVQELKDLDPESSAPDHILNRPIELQEVIGSIATLKNGKSSSDDLINNEILKVLSGSENQTLLLVKLFNHCLDSGTYPWNNSIITPLHKKGCKSNPDNYRAVAVSSNIGKLFSTILLNRILQYKSEQNPDPINQLGFSKGAQTYDHILTLQTITNKYKKLKKPVYAVFVDFRKAFDSVCREALFLKLYRLGIRGKIFETLNHMYTNSTGQIKLSGYLSNKFPISKGTEQGHPLSPDLFKIYIKDLSPKLDLDNCPRLLNTLVSHLLWADDLIMLALDPFTLQKQLEQLHEFCLEWGIEINAEKTKLIKFNKNYESPSDSYIKFHIGQHSLKEVESYCYLGMDIHSSGSLAPARKSLKCKAMRALYSLKSTINKTKLSFRALTTLFDSLIKPIILYGAPIYTPDMNILKHMVKFLNNPSTMSHTDFLRKLSQLDCEKVHLHFLKWSLGINKRASNTGAWGETGRYPLIYECINLTNKYLKRVKNLNDSSLVSLAFKEQVSMDLDWYRKVKPILAMDPNFKSDHVTASNLRSNIPINERYKPSEREDFLFHNGFKKRIPHGSVIAPNHSGQFSPYKILKLLKQNFKVSWQSSLNSSRKLEFYCTVKQNFSKESYLDFVKDYTDRAQLTRIRISAHTLEIEIGRRNGIPREDRICKLCYSLSATDTIENESHFINHCSHYSELRDNIHQKINSITSETNHGTNCLINLTNIETELVSQLSITNQCHLLRIIARFVSQCFNQRQKFLDSKTPT